jgi:hypothetical protein
MVTGKWITIGGEAIAPGQRRRIEIPVSRLPTQTLIFTRRRYTRHRTWPQIVAECGNSWR